MSEHRFTSNKVLIASVLFVVTGLAILFLFPNEAKFKYEFAKGKPWQHTRLIAPFSFAINKTIQQIDAEKDSIKNNHTSFFVWDETVGVKKRKSIQDNYFSKNKNSQLALFIDSLLTESYKKCIIDPIVLERLKHKEIYTIKDNVSELVPIQNIYTPKKLFIELGKIIQSSRSLFIENDSLTSIDDLEIENFIKHNITFDQTLTTKLLDQQLEKISKTKGLVQKGELIISTGEIISGSDFEILRSYRSEYETRYSNSGSLIHILGNMFIIGSPLTLLFLFLFQYRKKILLDKRKLLFILSSMLLFIALASINNSTKLANIYLFPVIILPIIIRAFFDARLANFVFIISLLITSYLLPNSFEYIFIQFISGTFAIFSLTHITRRGDVFKTSLIVFIAYSITYFGMSMIQESDWHKINWLYTAYFAGNALMITLSYPLIYLSEKIFGFTSNLTLLELSDTNHPLLKKLSEKTPGTFQHSLQVANIAEELIRAIGGNPLLVRTGALYHDIGKLKNPIYYTENQSDNCNPHSELTAIESAQIIIKHVPDGLQIAKKYKLPQAICDFIPMHQGTLTTKFFISTFKKENPDKEIDLSLFTYPGPKPFSKETAVVMIADSIEAASRSLKAYTPEAIEEIIDNIIDYQFKSEQFENVNMTFKDLKTIKQVLNDKLATIYHSRIAYPKESPLVKN